jgi:hypothetical protein
MWTPRVQDEIPRVSRTDPPVCDMNSRRRRTPLMSGRLYPTHERRPETPRIDGKRWNHHSSRTGAVDGYLTEQLVRSFSVYVYCDCGSDAYQLEVSFSNVFSRICRHVVSLSLFSWMRTSQRLSCRHPLPCLFAISYRTRGGGVPSPIFLGRSTTVQIFSHPPRPITMTVISSARPLLPSGDERL